MRSEWRVRVALAVSMTLPFLAVSATRVAAQQVISFGRSSELLRLDRDIDKARKKVADLRAQKAQTFDEMRRGLYCNKCWRSKSEIERGGENFYRHLQDVKGQAVAAPPEKIEQKMREYDAQIAQAQNEVDQVEQERQRTEADERAAQQREAERQQAEDRRKRQEAIDEYNQKVAEYNQKVAEENQRRQAERERQAEAARRQLAETQRKLQQQSQGSGDGFYHPPKDQTSDPGSSGNGQSPSTDASGNATYQPAHPNPDRVPLRYAYVTVDASVVTASGSRKTVLGLSHIFVYCPAETSPSAINADAQSRISSDLQSQYGNDYRVITSYVRNFSEQQDASFARAQESRRSGYFAVVELVYDYVAYTNKCR